MTNLNNLTETTLLAPLEWHNEKRKVKDLVPYEFNPRILTEEKKEKLINSLRKFNLAEVPAVNTDNVIVAGHQRVKILMLLDRGEELIDVRIPNRPLTEIEFKEYNITSNVPAGFWDVDVLEEHFADIDLESLGLNIGDIDVLEDLIPEEFLEEEEKEFDPEPPKEPISIEGDIYELRSLKKELVHRIICGDSTSQEVFKTLLNQEKINLTVTDPPYNVDYTGGATQKRDKIANDKMDKNSFYQFLYDFYSQAFNFSEEGAPIYVFHADTEGVNFRSALVDAGFKFSQCLIWKKNSIVMSRQDYHWLHEPCLYGWKQGAAHPWYSDRKQRTVLEFDRPTKSVDHPTMKPIELMSYLITNSSKQRDIVFDGFLGSGSTLIACEKHWRSCRGIELDPKYSDVEVKRWVKYMTENNLEFQVLKNGVKLAAEEVDLFLKEQ
ncbi:DNA modification methylase [Gillisia sp. Hel1_33_143]|uniref:DNA modification methylase n=1 Tax=Gillisia sp. Hel1_33_143 TaxID=1336796 RepID=UPI00087A7DA8|nr:DNA modification methylase [Gillisia sp. Hel1_33_143]SDS12465.1 DNA modification methylase [Gillisia sp. Hel1_33_143]